ncbi:hypothetical protein Dimus_033521 [Dionaea muscipula]
MQKLQQQQAAAASGGGISSSMKDCKFGQLVGVDGHVHGRELVGVDALPPSMMQMRMKMQKLQQQAKLEMHQEEAAAAASGGGGSGGSSSSSMKSLKCYKFGQLVGEGDHVHRRREKIAMELRRKMQKLQQQRQAAAASVGGGGGGSSSSSIKSVKCCKSGLLVGECDHVQRRRELVGVDVLPPSMMQFRMKVQKLQQAAAAAGSGSSQQQQQAALMSNMLIRNVLSSNVRTISSEGGRNERLSAFSDAIAEDATAGVMQLTLEPSITTTKEIRGHWRE